MKPPRCCRSRTPSRTAGPVAAALLLGRGALGASSGPCECLNWRRSYEAGVIKCGEGLELYFASNRTNLSKWELWDVSSLFHETCYSLYQRIDHSGCLNIRRGASPDAGWDAGLWCYVRGECRSLGGGHAVVSRGLLWSAPRGVSWKVCRPGEDASLRGLGPAALLARARAWAAGVAPGQPPLDLSGLARQAWLSLRPQLWWHVEGAWLAGNHTALPPALRATLASGEGMVLDVAEHRRGDAVVLFGAQTWQLRHDPGACPDTTFCLSCLGGGCPEEPLRPEPEAPAGARPPPPPTPGAGEL
uniref:Uncharacterized protein n=1 Tax=Alexandrium monilatum TaxID=311494 RepID=A0A7S4PWZ5_9DINO